MIKKNNKLTGKLQFLLILVFFPFLSFAQKANWQNLDLAQDTTFGISTEKAYQDLLKGKTGKTVIVGVLDGGVDLNHEDLKSVIWTNKKEKAGNKIDDDKNGYADDVHGWNFLGSSKGSVSHEALELTRILRSNAKKFKDPATVAAADQPAYEQYKIMRADYDKQVQEATEAVSGMQGFKNVLDKIVVRIGKKEPNLADFQAFAPANELEGRLKSVMVEQLKDDTFAHFYDSQITKGIEHYADQLKYNLNMDFDPRPQFVGDKVDDSNERSYGNNDVRGPDASHGSHVSGIIAADRTNTLGIKGVADHVLIMGVRAVPDGDERDKDVANSIRYAVDNGAKVLNMSFGKAYTTDKAAVDAAVKYAMSKDVLIVQAAGNDNKNIDSTKNFPDRRYLTGDTAKAYITVGASGWKDDEDLKASFSNYGKTMVDVFAPGEQIYSTIPDSKYEAYDGTSMASPVVAGLAALIRSYYPKLSAIQVKDIILKSVVKVNHSVNVAVGEASKTVPFADLCVTGGIVNAYKALQLAAQYK
jgi:subtilisin family serine protease